MATKKTRTRITLTVEEVAELLGIGRGSAYDAVRRGELPSVKFGRRILIPKTALDALISKGRMNSTPSPSPINQFPSGLARIS